MVLFKIIFEFFEILFMLKLEWIICEFFIVIQSANLNKNNEGIYYKWSNLGKFHQRLVVYPAWGKRSSTITTLVLCSTYFCSSIPTSNSTLQPPSLIINSPALET